MWKKLSVTDTTIDCQRPFSFFFDFIDVYWKAKTESRIALHRICTLCRKQNVSFVIVEAAFSFDGVCEEIDALDGLYGSGGSAEALSLSFFASGARIDDIETVNERELLSHVVLINYFAPPGNDCTNSYIFEAIVRPPAMPSANGESTVLLNNYICFEGEFRRIVKGREFTLPAIFSASRTDKHTHAPTPDFEWR